MRTQRNQIVQLSHTLPKLFVQQAKHKWNGSSARAIWNNHQHPPVIDLQGVTYLPYQVARVLFGYYRVCGAFPDHSRFPLISSYSDFPPLPLMNFADRM